MQVGWLLVYVGLAALAVGAGDRIGALMCLMVRRRCGAGPLLHLPAWIRIGVGFVIPAVGLSGVVCGIVGIYGGRAFWVLTHHMEIIGLVGFFVVGVLASVFVGGFCSRH